MIVLDSVNKSIQIVMSATASSNNPSYVCTYADNTGSTFVEGSSDGVLSGTTPVTIVSAPSANVRRIIKDIYIENLDNSAVTITMSYNNNGSLRTIFKNTLNPNDTRYLNQTVDSNGYIKTLNTSNGVTLIQTDSNLTGGPITSSGTLGLASNISFYSGNVTTSNTSIGTSVVNINTLNAAINGLNSQIPVNYASTANLSVTYANGTLGVGATLTATASGVFTLDGVTPILADRVLIKDQTAQAQNGVYTVTAPGTLVTPFILTRAVDYDQSAEIAAGDGFYVISGSTQNNTTWVQQTPAPVTVGTTALVFTQFAAGTAVLPISRGGTSANTASQALTNLGGIGIGKAIAAAIVFGGG